MRGPTLVTRLAHLVTSGARDDRSSRGSLRLAQDHDPAAGEPRHGGTGRAVAPRRRATGCGHLGYPRCVAELVGERDRLVLRLTAAEHLEGMHRDIAVPRSSVRSIRVTEDVWSELRGIRAPGTGLPGVIAVGTRRGSFGKDFAAVHGSGRGVVVELVGQEFDRLVVTVADPEGTVAGLTV
jgi:hypothetical protein